MAVDNGIVHRKAGIRNWVSLVGVHTDGAGAGGELTVRQKLVQRGVSLKIADDVLHADPTGVETCGVPTRVGTRSERDGFAGVRLNPVKTAVNEANRARVVLLDSAR